jgi:hypothetical protein
MPEILRRLGWRWLVQIRRLPLRAMATELVFSGGEKVSVVGTNAETLTLNLNRAKDGPVRMTSGVHLGEGWVDVQTDNGVILVNPVQVAYVRDVAEDEPILDEAVSP